MPFAPATSEERHLLRAACRLWHLQTGFTNTDRELVEASSETLIRLLAAVSGREIRGAETLRELIRESRAIRLKRLIEPVHVIWDSDASKGMQAYLPESRKEMPLHLRIRTEEGQVIEQDILPGPVERTIQFERETFVRVRLPLPNGLRIGYHRVEVEGEGMTASCLLMCASRQVGRGAANPQQKRWGLFSPLYAIQSESDWGIGSLTEMEKAQEFTRSRGGTFFGTLPMLPIWCEGRDCDPSPYSPVSRLFWNEVYLDVDGLVRESGSEKARGLIASPAFQEELARLKGETFVDYGAVFEAKKEVLGLLADEFFAGGGDRSPEYLEFLSQVPDAEKYSRFRARGDDREHKYHLYVQFQMDRCMKRLSSRAARDEIAGLYLDFPVGVSRGGYDAKEYAWSFMTEANAGAPPDQLFIGGQEWGFAPLHPIRAREQGYEYFIKCVRHHMKYASVLRLDHIMAFHRIYAIPLGMKPKEGSYLRYCPDEFYALLSIEAERAGVRVVGEDLGTVPQEVRDALKEHDCLRMWVLPFEAGDKPMTAVKRVPERSLACLNTHDMVPFAGHCSQRDIGILDELKVVDHETSLQMKKDRTKTLTRWKKDLGVVGSLDDRDVEWVVARKLLEQMAASPAELLLVNIEDLWSEREPQNVPGTWKEYPNWRRKMKFRLEDWTRQTGAMDALKRITDARTSAGKGMRSETTGSRDATI